MALFGQDGWHMLNRAFRLKAPSGTSSIYLKWTQRSISTLGSFSFKNPELSNQAKQPTGDCQSYDTDVSWIQETKLKNGAYIKIDGFTLLCFEGDCRYYRCWFHNQQELEWRSLSNREDSWPCLCSPIQPNEEVEVRSKPFPS